MNAPEFQFEEAYHRYVVDNQLQPHVTCMLETFGVIDYSAVPEQVLTRKTMIGHAVHKITHYVDEDGLTLEFAVQAVYEAQAEELQALQITADDLLGYSCGWLKFVDVSGFEVFPGYIERRHVATVNGMNYGMTIDRAGKLRRQATILDLKCTAAREKSWPVQLAGYALGLPKPAGVVRWERAAVWLKSGGDYEYCPGGRKTTDRVLERRDEEVFLAALRLSWWKRENYGRFV